MVSPKPAQSVQFDPKRALSHPLWWTALVLLLVNDHFLKGSLLIPHAVTGKLSDFAGMIVAPLLLAAILGTRSRTGILFCHGAVAAVFAAINLAPTAALLFSQTLATIGIPFRIWTDPSDLVALPFLLLSWYLLVPRAHRARSPRTWIPKLAIVIGAIACLASSPWPVAQPTVVPDRVLFEHHRGVLFVLDANSGTMLRSLLATGMNDTPPAIFDRILYQVRRDGRITGIHIDNPQTPFALWRHPDPDAWIRILLVDAHRLYISSSDKRLHAVDRVFGETLWILPAETHHIEELTIDGDTLVITDGSRIRAVNTRTGTPSWTVHTEDTIGPAKIHGGVAYASTSRGLVVGLDVVSGVEVWRYDAGKRACSSRFPQVFVQSDVIFACFSGTTHAIALESKSLRWSHESLPIAVTEDVLIVQRSADTLLGIAPLTGKVLWSRELSEDVGSSAVAQGEMVYLRDRKGKLHAIEARTGRIYWSFDWPSDEGGKDVAVIGSELVVSRK